MELTEHSPVGVPLSIDALLERTVATGASDLHLTAGSFPAVRRHGHIELLDDCPMLDPDLIRQLIYRITTTEQQKHLELKRQLDFAYGIRGLARFRVNAYYQRESLAAAFRTIPADIRSLEQLGLPSSLHELTTKPRGLVLVTGPTGSGKSTTLASMIDEINGKRTDHIITIEDPIEFLHHHKRCIVNQREIGQDATGFADALRGALRQDPDVILLGEIRDLDTLETALKAADTGHLVFSTLHTTDATQTINRVLSFYPPHQQSEVRFALSTALAAIVSLRLVPRADRPGRVPAAEVLINTAAVREQIRDLNATLNIPDLIKEGTSQYGMQSFDQSLMQWYTKGVISYESALFYASNPSEFALRVQGVAGSSDTSWDGFQTATAP